MDEQKIKEAAYALWEKDGKPVGRDLEHWFKASNTPGEEVDTDADRLPPGENRAGPEDETADTPRDSPMADSRKRKKAKI